MEVLLEVAESQVTLTPLSSVFKLVPWRKDNLYSQTLALLADVFSKPATELAGALVLVISSKNVQGNVWVFTGVSSRGKGGRVHLQED